MAPTGTVPVAAQAGLVIDLLLDSYEGIHRTLGSNPDGGTYGVPVAGGHDIDGDGLADWAISAMTNSSLGRSENGLVYLIHGTGTIEGTVDTTVLSGRTLRIAGAHSSEHAGSEIWIDDVTGDGTGDLLICSQNYEPATGRSGAGKLTILVGGTAVRDFALTETVLDLASPPASLTVTEITGGAEFDRFCMWARAGDVDGDGTNDLVVGADRVVHYTGVGCSATADQGTAWVILGGTELASGTRYDLLDFGSPGFGLAGRVAEIRPPSPACDYHFGATVQAADLDGNGKAEVLVGAALNRVGGLLAPPSGFGDAGPGGRSPDGALYIVWDDAFPAPPWVDGFSLVAGANALSSTVIDGSTRNVSFGEEILGGLDYDGDQQADLFVGDLTGAGPAGLNAGIGHVFFDAAELKGLDFDLDMPPASLEFTVIEGPNAGAIGADTAAHGDFDGDGQGDLMFSSPHGNPQSRTHAGVVHIAYGQEGAWPAVVELFDLPDPDDLFVAEIRGARGNNAGGNSGDTLAYSAAAGDVDGDGRSDLIINEMLGDNGSLHDVGNLLVISGTRLLRNLLFRDGFESGGTSLWSNAVANGRRPGRGVRAAGPPRPGRPGP